MTRKVYGTADEDPSAADLLAKYIETSECIVKYIVHHPRRPLDGRACQQPGSLRVQAVLTNLTVVTAYQSHPGAIPRILFN